MTPERVPRRNGTARRAFTLLILVALTVGVLMAGCSEAPTGFKYPNNAAPVIDSVTATPTTLGPGDSTLIRCYASDPDGDRLVYDWITDAKLKINGALPWDNFLYNTDSSWRGVHNADLPNRISDTAWIRCRARDGKGGEASMRVEILLTQPTPRR